MSGKRVILILYVRKKIGRSMPNVWFMYLSMKKALLFAKLIVDIILSKLNKYQLVPCTQCMIYPLTMLLKTITISTIIFSISGEPWDISHKFVIAIDTKFQSNARKTIHYPYIFASLCEHKKSIDPKIIINLKLNFVPTCIKYPTIIESIYFHLFSQYKKVDALGKCCNNVMIENTRDVTTTSKHTMTLPSDIILSTSLY